MSDIVIAVLGSGAFATIVNLICTSLQKRSDDKNGIKASLRLVLKDRLRFLCLTYIQQGWIYEDELEDIIAMHNCYHDDLKGNGYLDTLMAKVKALDVRGVGK